MRFNVKKFLQFSIGQIGGSLISFISLPIITYFISPEEYGRTGMFTLFITILQLVIFLGMDQGYVKYYYDEENKRNLFINSLIPSALLIGVLEIVLFVYRYWICDFLFSSADIICVYAVMIDLPALALERFGLLEIRMSQRGLKYSIIHVLLKALTIVATVLLFFTYNRNYVSVVLGTVTAQIIIAIILILDITREVNSSHSAVKYDRDLIAKLLRYSLPIIPATIIGWVLNGMDKVMLKQMGTLYDVGLYTAAFKYASILSMVKACFSTYWVPLAHSWNNENADKSNFTEVGNCLTMLLSVMFVSVVTIKDPLFHLLSSDYLEGEFIMPFLIFVPIMNAMSEVTVMGIYFSEKTQYTIVVSGVSAAVNLILNWLLIPMYGAIGASIATGISYIVFFWIRTLISRKFWYQFPLGNYVFVTLVLVLCCTANILIRNPIIYAINVFLLVLLIFVQRKYVGVAIRIVRNTLKRKKYEGA